MSFKDDYTTLAIKEAITIDKEISDEDKVIEESKIVVSDEAYLNAEMTEKLINKIEQLRVGFLVRR